MNTRDLPDLIQTARNIVFDYEHGFPTEPSILELGRILRRSGEVLWHDIKAPPVDAKGVTPPKCLECYDTGQIRRHATPDEVTATGHYYTLETCRCRLPK